MPPWPSACRRRPRQTLAAMATSAVAAPSESRRDARKPAATPACGPQSPHSPGKSGAEAHSRCWDGVARRARTAHTGYALLLVFEQIGSGPNRGPAKGALARDSLWRGSCSTASAQVLPPSQLAQGSGPHNVSVPRDRPRARRVWPYSVIARHAPHARAGD
jgi:hypothetical protein